MVARFVEVATTPIEQADEPIVISPRALSLGTKQTSRAQGDPEDAQRAAHLEGA